MGGERKIDQNPSDARAGDGVRDIGENGRRFPKYPSQFFSLPSSPGAIPIALVSLASTGEKMVEGREMAVAAVDSGAGDRRAAAAARDRDVRHALAPAGDPAAGIGAEAADHVRQRAV